MVENNGENGEVTPIGRAAWINAVTRYLDDTGLSRAELARRVNTSAASITRILQGEQDSPELAERISIELQLPHPQTFELAPHDRVWLSAGQELRALDPSVWEQTLDRVQRFVELKKQLTT